jgi:hypothetical protein
MVKHKLKARLSFGTKRMKFKTKDIARCRDSTHAIGSNSFPNVHVYHNVGSQEGGTCLDDRNKP